MRVYHVAQESGLASRVLLQMLHARGIEMPSHMATLTEDQAGQLNEAIQSVRGGGSIAPKPEPAPAPTPQPVVPTMVENAPPGSVPPGTLVGRRKKVEEDEVKKPAAARRRKKAGDEKRQELSEELLREGLQEVRGLGTAAPTAPVPGPPSPTRRMPTRPVPQSGPGGRALSRLQQRRAPRTLVRQRRRGKQAPTLAQGKIPVSLPITVKELSQAISVRAPQLIRSLMQSGMMANMNTTLEEETIQVLALEFDRDIEIKAAKPAADAVLEDLDLDQQDEERLEPRPPVVAVLGHVDHGKTSLLDAIRATDVAAGEAGGITQHIGAYQVTTSQGNVVTFLDTPGHEAFTDMRARGANVADICILVVAADDGVMPQTEEAIGHAKAAEVPMVVALNKIDKPNANRDRILNQLSTLGLVWDKWGGDTVIEPVSAMTGEGIEHLVEMLALQAEMGEIQADAHRSPVGTVIEASKSDAKGVLATLLVQAGTLRLGDIVISGSAYGRIRAMTDHKGEDVDEAPPSMPVQVTGLGGVPEAGSRFYVLQSLSEAKNASEEIARQERAADRADRPAVTLENVFAQIEDESEKELRIILKADTKGSVEAIEKKLNDLSNEEVGVKVLHGMVGAITESDVKLAIASRAIIIGFHVLSENPANKLAEKEGIQIRTYQIIYDVEDDVRKAQEGLLEPEKREEVLGHATVKEVFTISKVGTIAGCAVTDGLIRRTNGIRLYRDGKQIRTDLILENLKRFKDDVKEVKNGFECGIKVQGFDDIKVDDVFECFEVVEVKRTLK